MSEIGKWEAGGEAYFVQSKEVCIVEILKHIFAFQKILKVS